MSRLKKFLLKGGVRLLVCSMSESVRNDFIYGVSIGALSHTENISDEKINTIKTLMKVTCDNNIVALGVRLHKYVHMINTVNEYRCCSRPCDSIFSCVATASRPATTREKVKLVNALTSAVIGTRADRGFLTALTNIPPLMDKKEEIMRIANA